MKNSIRYKARFIVMLLTVAFSLALTSCSDDDISAENFATGRWYLISFGVDNPQNHTCTWGEFIAFSGDEMVWGSRQGGDADSYTFKINGDRIKCKIEYGTNDDIEFTVLSVDGSTAITKSDDGITRIWKR